MQSSSKQPTFSSQESRPDAAVIRPQVAPEIVSDPIAVDFTQGSASSAQATPQPAAPPNPNWAEPPGSSLPWAERAVSPSWVSKHIGESGINPQIRQLRPLPLHQTRPSFSSLFFPPSHRRCRRRPEAAAINRFFCSALVLRPRTPCLAWQHAPHSPSLIYPFTPRPLLPSSTRLSLHPPYDLISNIFRFNRRLSRARRPLCRQTKRSCRTQPGHLPA